MSENNWRSPQFRANIVSKINDHIIAQRLTVRTDAAHMEQSVFAKAKSEQEYLAYIARLIVYLRGDDDDDVIDDEDDDNDEESSSLSSQQHSYYTIHMYRYRNAKIKLIILPCISGKQQQK